MELRKFVLFARHRSMCLLGDQSFSLKKKKENLQENLEYMMKKQFITNS